MNRMEQLIEQFINQSIDERGSAELVEILKKSPDCYELMFETYRQDRELAHLFKAPSSEKFTQHVLETIQVESNDFAQTVVRRIKHHPSSRHSTRMSSARCKDPRKRSIAFSWGMSIAALVALLISGFILYEYKTSSLPQHANSPIDEKESSSPVAVIQKGSAEYMDKSGVWSAMPETCTMVSGMKIRTAADSVVLCLYPDGSYVKLQPASTIMLDDSISVLSGKTFASVKKRKKEFVLNAPACSLSSLGSAFLLGVSKSGSEMTVYEGVVNVASSESEQKLAVYSGHMVYADIVMGMELFPVKSLEWLRKHEKLKVIFGYINQKLSEGVVMDLAEVYDPRKGFGWDGEIAFLPYPPELEKCARYRRNFMRPQPKVLGMPSRGYFPPADYLKVTDLRYVYAGSTELTDTWSMAVPNGRYRLTLKVGGNREESGPHRVLIEDKVVVDNRKSNAHEILTVRDVVDVKDGELTVTVGGHMQKLRPSRTGTTLLYALTIERIHSANR